MADQTYPGINFRIDPDRRESQVRFNETVDTKEELDEKAQEYGFHSRAAFLRHMVRLGMNTLVEQDPVKNDQSSKTPDEKPVTIRELVPEGEENAVDMTDEFWEEILRDRMLDIVEEDPEIKRDGYSVYK